MRAQEFIIERKKRSKKTRGLGGYFFPGYGFYGGDSGEGGGDGGGGGESKQGMSEAMAADQVLDYVNRLHHDFDIEYSITDHPEWELKNIPLRQLHLDPDGEEQDPYNRVNWVDYDKVRDLIPKIGSVLKSSPIVVDSQGWIIDGNHRAMAAVEAGMDSVPAYVPVKQGVAESENNDTAISLSKLGKFHPGADSLAEFVPERATARYALHPDKWESTFYSLTNKDSDKLKYYGPKKISIPPGTLVGDMAIANKFYRAKTPEEKQQYAELYKASLQPYPVDVSAYRMPELLIPRQGMAENIPQPGESSGAPKQFGPDAKIQTRQMTVKQIISSVPGLPYYNNVVDDWDAKDYSWGVTKKVIEYATYLKQHPESLSQLPPILVLNGKFEDGAHRVSAIWLLQQRMDPKNPLWANAKLNVQFVKQGVAEDAQLPGDFKLMGQNLFLKNLAQNLKQRYPDATVKLSSDRVTAYHNEGDDEALTVMGTEVMDSGYIGVGLDDAFTESFQGVLVPTIKQTTEQLLAANPGTKPALFLSTDNWNPDAWTHIASKLGYRLVADDEELDENFADGKNPGRKGLAKRSGVNTKASVSSLRKTAKNSSGEKQRMAHWLANMKAGRAKARKK
jgi:hypothetical protein